MRSSAAGMTSGSIRFGMWPSRPISTALSVPWPRPVSASEPNTSARTRATCGQVARSPRATSATKRAAARIGPTVCEELGPMPILNRSKVLTAMDSRDCSRESAVFYAPAQPRYPNAATMRLTSVPARRLPPVRPSPGGAGRGARADFEPRVHRRRCRLEARYGDARAGAARRARRRRTRLAVRRRPRPRLRAADQRRRGRRRPWC